MAKKSTKAAPVTPVDTAEQNTATPVPVQTVAPETEQPTREAPVADAATAAVDVGASTIGQDAHLIEPGPGEVLGTLAGVQQQDGTVVELKDMPEQDLRQLADDLVIENAATLSVDELVTAIEKEPVLIPDTVYIVDRELLEHDGQSYTRGDTVPITDEKAAAVLLARGAIVLEMA